MRWTEQQLRDYEARSLSALIRRERVPFSSPRAYPEQESDLHAQILDYARQREWVIIHSRMDKMSTVSVGTADFVFLLPGSKTLVIEAKVKNRKPTTKQLGFLAHCKKNGHTAAVVWSFEEFLNLCHPKPTYADVA